MGKRLVYCLGSLMERLAPYEYPSSNLLIEGELAYVRSNAREDRRARFEAIVELRGVQAENAMLHRQVMALRLRVAELEEQVSTL